MRNRVYFVSYFVSYNIASLLFRHSAKVLKKNKTETF